MTNELATPSDDMATTSSNELHDHYRTAATESWEGDDIQIDNKAAVSESEDGAWVAAWVWVPAQQ